MKVWSLMGGLIHTFRGHSRAVTNLLLHPTTSSIVLTCSLDGTVRMWSLDTMDCIYRWLVLVFFRVFKNQRLDCAGDQLMFDMMTGEFFFSAWWSSSPSAFLVGWWLMYSVLTFLFILFLVNYWTQEITISSFHNQVDLRSYYYWAKFSWKMV